MKITTQVTLIFLATLAVCAMLLLDFEKDPRDVTRSHAAWAYVPPPPTPCPDCDGCSTWGQGCGIQIEDLVDAVMSSTISEAKSDAGIVLADVFDDWLVLSPQEESTAASWITQKYGTQLNPLSNYTSITGTPNKDPSVDPTYMNGSASASKYSSDLSLKPGYSISQAIDDLIAGEFTMAVPSFVPVTTWTFGSTTIDLGIGAYPTHNFNSDSFSGEATIFAGLRFSR